MHLLPRCLSFVASLLVVIPCTAIASPLFDCLNENAYTSAAIFGPPFAFDDDLTGADAMVASTVGEIDATATATTSCDSSLGLGTSQQATVENGVLSPAGGSPNVILNTLGSATVSESEGALPVPVVLVVVWETTLPAGGIDPVSGGYEMSVEIFGPGVAVFETNLAPGTHEFPFQMVPNESYDLGYSLATGSNVSQLSTLTMMLVPEPGAHAMVSCALVLLGILTRLRLPPGGGRL